jgi:hypothetical protein
MCILAATFAIGTLCIELPGVYFDAVYPDYLAAVGAFPGVDNFTQITKHVGLPLLGNFYHGTLTAAVQYVVLKIAGRASVWTLRVVNLSYVAILGIIIFMIGKNIYQQKVIPLCTALICVTSQGVLAITRTQYYIMLPGCIFFLLSVVCLNKGMESFEDGRRADKDILLAGVLQGLAFYAYFIFLFLAPASVVLLILNWKKNRQRLRYAVIYLYGILIGSILYFAGYFDSAVTNFLGYSTRTLVILTAGVLLLLIVFLIPVIGMLVPAFAKYQRTILKIYIGGAEPCYAYWQSEAVSVPY